MMILRRVFLLLTLLWAAPGLGLVIVGFDGEPFYFKNGSEGVAGACHEILQDLCAKEKLHCKFKIAPLAVVLEMMQTGKADVACPLATMDERNEYIAFSNNIFKTRFAFFGLPETATKVTTLKDLSSFSVGVFYPSRVSQSLEALRDESPVKFEVIKESSNVSTLLRAEKISKVLAYMNHDIGERWIEKSHSPLVEAPLPGETLAYNIGFSKKTLTEEKFKKYVASLEAIIKREETQAAIAKLGLRIWSDTPPIETTESSSNKKPLPK